MSFWSRLTTASLLHACQTCVAIASWMTVSNVLIFLNKSILSHDHFEYPMFLSGLGIVFSGCAAFTCCRVLKCVECKKEVTLHFFLTRIMPVGLFAALALAFGNLVYLYLGVAFIHMLKAFGPVTTMACAVAAGLEPPHTNLMLSVFIIGVGVATASCANDKLSYVGIIVQFLAMLSESARLVLTQKLLQGYSFNASMCSGFGAANALEYHVSNPSHTVEGLMYTSPACIFWLFLGWLVFESQRMIAANAFAKIAAAPLLYCCAAALGFLVNVTAYWTIQLTGGLTIKVLGTVKNAIVVLLGMIFLAEPVTALQLVGYGTSIGGFALYNWHKMHTAPPGYIHGSEKETQQPSLTEVKTVAVG